MSAEDVNEDPRQVERGVIHGSMPYVFLKDVPAGIRYYTEILGFTEEWNHTWEQNGGAGAVARLSRDGVPIELWTCQCPDKRHVGTSYFRLDTEDVDAIHAELAARDVKICVPLENQPWGDRDFTIEDPEGTWIYFCEAGGSTEHPDPE